MGEEREGKCTESAVSWLDFQIAWSFKGQNQHVRLSSLITRRQPLDHKKSMSFALLSKQVSAVYVSLHFKIF